MTGALFPAAVRTLDDAIAFLPRWAEMIGGELISGIETDELVDAGGAVAVVRVRPIRVLFRSSATELTVRLVFSADLEPLGYSFDLRRDNGATSVAPRLSRGPRTRARRALAPPHRPR